MSQLPKSISDAVHAIAVQSDEIEPDTPVIIRKGEQSPRMIEYFIETPTLRLGRTKTGEIKQAWSITRVIDGRRVERSFEWRDLAVIK